jgi:TRAP-type C4-dicarboxylate transport system permease small subunit
MDNQKNSKNIFTAIFKGSVIMAAMVLMIFYNAMARYFFNTGFPMFEELSRFAFIWTSILGAIIAYFENKHVGVDVLITKLTGKLKVSIQIVGDAIVVISLIVIMIGGWKYLADTATVLSPATNLPTGIISSSAFILAIIMLIKAGLNIAEHISKLKKSTKEEV